MKVDCLGKQFQPYSRKTKILDFGCGSGYFVSSLIDNGFKNVEGMDVSKVQIEYGKKDENWIHQLPVFDNFFKDKLKKEDLKQWAIDNFIKLQNSDLQNLTVERYNPYEK